MFRTTLRRGLVWFPALHRHVATGFDANRVRVVARTLAGLGAFALAPMFRTTLRCRQTRSLAMHRHSATGFDANRVRVVARTLTVDYAGAGAVAGALMFRTTLRRIRTWTLAMHRHSATGFDANRVRVIAVALAGGFATRRSGYFVRVFALVFRTTRRCPRARPHALHGHAATGFDANRVRVIAVALAGGFAIRRSGYLVRVFALVFRTTRRWPPERALAMYRHSATGFDTNWAHRCFRPPHIQLLAHAASLR